MSEKTITLTESELEKLVQRMVNKYLTEGIDVWRDNDGKRLVSLNDKHNNYVDTNDTHHPYLFSDTQRGYRTLSIFQRKETADHMDANPLLNALKQRKGWEFENATRDLKILLRKFVAASKLLPKYDTIIMTPSNNDLNKIVFRYLIRLIPHNCMFEEFFMKFSADEVYDNMIDDNYINSHFENPGKVYNDIDDAFQLMNTENNGIFSYKYLQHTKYREAIIQSMKVNMGSHNELNYAEAINGKDVLVFDDTITTGKTISDSGKAINDMFAPKSLTYVTLFSALADSNSSQQKITTV